MVGSYSLGFNGGECTRLAPRAPHAREHEINQVVIRSCSHLRTARPWELLIRGYLLHLFYSELLQLRVSCRVLTGLRSQRALYNLLPRSVQSSSLAVAMKEPIESPNSR